jgi:hypothetical protein
MSVNELADSVGQMTLLKWILNRNGIDWIKLAQLNGKNQAFVRMVINLQAI